MSFPEKATGGGGGGGVTTAQLNTAVNASAVSTLAAANTYSDTQDVQHERSVQDITALTAYTELTDKTTVFVEDVNNLYGYDAEGTGTVDGQSIVASATGVGRWKRVVTPTNLTPYDTSTQVDTKIAAVAIRLAPIASITALVAVANPKDFSIVNILSTDADYVFKLGATTGDHADGTATGFWSIQDAKSTNLSFGTAYISANGTGATTAPFDLLSPESKGLTVDPATKEIIVEYPGDYYLCPHVSLTGVNQKLEVIVKNGGTDKTVYTFKDSSTVNHAGGATVTLKANDRVRIETSPAADYSVGDLLNDQNASRIAFIPVTSKTINAIDNSLVTLPDPAVVLLGEIDDPDTNLITAGADNHLFLLNGVTWQNLNDNVEYGEYRIDITYKQGGILSNAGSHMIKRGGFETGMQFYHTSNSGGNWQIDPSIANLADGNLKLDGDATWVGAIIRLYGIKPQKVVLHLPTATQIEFKTASFDAALANNQLYLISAAANVTPTLPSATGVKGLTLTFKMIAKTAISVVIITPQAGQAIDGVVDGRETLYTVGDIVSLVSDGVGWVTVDKRYAKLAVIIAQTTAQVIPNQSTTLVNMQQAEYESTAGLANLTGDGINVFRSGMYNVSFSVRMSLSINIDIEVIITVNSVAVRLNNATQNGGLEGDMFVTVTAPLFLTKGQLVRASVWVQEGGKSTVVTPTASPHRPTLSVIEI